MKRFILIGYAANGDILFQPAGRVVEYANSRREALAQFVLGNWKPEDTERFHQVDIIGPVDENDRPID